MLIGAARAGARPAALRPVPARAGGPPRRPDRALPAGAAGAAPCARGAAGAGRRRGPASPPALGLAIGLEALPFEAAIGAGLALEFVCDPPAAGARAPTAWGSPARRSPPSCCRRRPQRWGVSVCDALGVNLVLAPGGRRRRAVRRGRADGRTGPGACASPPWPPAGAAALRSISALKPACIRGVFAEVDPRLRPFWFDHVSELHPIGRVLADAPAEAGVIILWGLVGAASLFGVVALRPRERRFDPALLTYALCLVQQRHGGGDAAGPLITAAAAATARAGLIGWRAT